MRTRTRSPLWRKGLAVSAAVAVSLTGLGATATAAQAADGPQPLIHYSFDGANGTTVADSSGNNYNATIRQNGGSVTGGALSLPGGSAGTAAYLDIPTAGLVGKKDLTISTWLSPRSGNGNVAAAFIGAPVASGASFSSGYWLLNPANPNGYVKSVVTNTVNAGAPWGTEVGPGATNAASTGARTPAGLSLYTTVISGTTGQLSVYINGTRIAQNAISRDVASFGQNLVSYLGRSTYPDAGWNGLVDDYAVYASALSETDVKALYGAQALDRAVAGVSVPTTALTDFTVPTTSAGATVSWASNNAAIAVTGTTAKVTRPAAGAGDAAVTLTATFTVGTETRTQTYPVLVTQQLSETEKVSRDLAAISIRNLDNVRGNFSVPTTGAEGSSITWSIAAGGEANAELRDGVRADARTVEVKRPAAGSAAVDVQLTAIATNGAAKSTRTFTARVQPMPGGSQETEAYFWTFFTGEGDGAERVSIAASKGNDALSWNTLNQGKPIFSSTVGTQGLRDPFIIRAPHGDKFYMIATDLKVAGLAGGFTTAQISGSKYIEVWESDDLVNWSEQRHVKVSSDFAGNTWAPEAYWDEELDTFVVFWASNLYPTTNVADRTGVTYNRMMYATTDDFVTFSDAKVWSDVRRGNGLGLIDSTVAKKDGVYHRFTKDEASMTIRHEKSTDLLATISGTLPGTTGPANQWTLVEERVASGLPNGEPNGTYSSGEGANIFAANDGDVNNLDWFLFIDQPNYHGGPNHYVPFGTNNLDQAGSWQALGSKLRQGLPQNADGGKPRHGTVIPVTRAEYQKVLEAYAPNIAVKTVDAIDVTTDSGTAPALPAQARLTKADGSVQTADVKWDAVDAAKYTSAGTFTVSGIAQDDSRMPVEATVTVRSLVKVQFTAEARCVAGKVQLALKAVNTGDTAASLAMSSTYGSKNATVAAGATTSAVFATRAVSVTAGEATVNVTQGSATGTVTAAYAAKSCG